MTKARKIFAILLTVLLCFGLAGCAKEEQSPVATAAPTRPWLGAPMIGVLYPGVYDIPDSYSCSHFQSISAAMDRLSLDVETQHLAAENVAFDRDSVHNAVKGLIDLGANVIFATDPGYSPYMLEIAEEYPHAVFCHLGGTARNGKNLVDFSGEIYKAYFLAGCVAGYQSLSEENNAIGFVSAYGKENPDAVSAVNAFTVGAQATNAEAKIYLKVLKNAHDSMEERIAAESLVMQHGCGVLAQYTNTDATLTTAAYRGIPVCGPYFATETQMLDGVLVSPRLNWFQFYYTAIDAAKKTDYAHEFVTQLGFDRYYAEYPSTVITLWDGGKSKPLPEDMARILSRGKEYLKDCAPTDPDDPEYVVDEENPPYIRREGIFSGERIYELSAVEFGVAIFRRTAKDLVDIDGNVIVQADQISLTTDEIRAMDFYIEGIILVEDTQ